MSRRSRLGKRQRQEAKELVDFIGAHGGRLGAFRGYGVSRPSLGLDGAGRRSLGRRAPARGTAQIEYN